MGKIDKSWDERIKKEIEGNPASVLAEALLEFLKESYIAGWIDCDKAREAEEKKDE